MFPQAGVLAGAAFIVAPLASAQHQALQPLSLALLCLAGFAYLLSRPPSHLEETMFAATGLLLALSHPYSTVVIGLGLLVTILTLALWLRQFRFLAPVGVGAAGAITYLAVIAQDFDRFLQFLSPPSSTGVLPPSESVDPGGARNSATWAFVEAWKFRLPVLLGLAGWAIAWKKPRPALTLQVLLAAFGGIYLVALAVPGSIPNRVLAITAVPLAPFLGYALLRMTPAGAIPALLACALLAGTGVHAALQFTPWARDGQALPQPLDDPPGMDSVTDYFLGLEGGRLAVTNPISSHYIFKGNTSVDVRGFSGVDDPERAPREYYFYREVAEDSGFAMTRPGRGRTAEFHFYPTAGNLELVASMDRIADVGEIQVHRH